MEPVKVAIAEANAQVNRAQLAVDEAETRMNNAQVEFNDLKRILSKKWLETHPNDSDSLALYLSQDSALLLAKETLILEKKRLEHKEETLVLEKKRLEHKEQILVLEKTVEMNLLIQANKRIAVGGPPLSLVDNLGGIRDPSNVMDDLTSQLQSFSLSHLIGDTINSSEGFLPYPQVEFRKVFVRKCYVEVFDLLMTKIKTCKSFAISGTPGIGKSIFFMYLLHRFMNDGPEPLAFKPTGIVYQTQITFKYFDLKSKVVYAIGQIPAEKLLGNKGEILYLIDGHETPPLPAVCPKLFISSPRSKHYKHFVRQTQAIEWFFPTWTLEELLKCGTHCYAELGVYDLEERFSIYGGVARMIFSPEYSTNPMESALNDAEAIKCVRNIGVLTRMLTTSHTLLHIVVSPDGLYNYKHLDIASKYVGEQLWIRHAAQMMINIQELYGGSPSELSGHLFEIYGHRTFLVGGKKLKCRCLDDGKVSLLTLDAHTQLIAFGKDSIPQAVVANSYYEPSDTVNFPSIDSFSQQGMFQFTVASTHPIADSTELKKIVKLLTNASVQPKLYFVVPPSRFNAFKKQDYKPGKPTDGFTQYVLELTDFKAFEEQDNVMKPVTSPSSYQDIVSSVQVSTAQDTSTKRVAENEIRSTRSMTRKTVLFAQSRDFN